MRDLIDFVFCKKNFGFQNDDEVLAWFGRQTLDDFRTFSESFSPVDYLLDHEDLRSAGVDPVVHYLNHGSTEPRTVKSIKHLRQYSPKGFSPSTNDAPPKIAIVFHIYYQEFVDIFLEKLDLLKALDFDIFISVSEEILRNNQILIRERLGVRLRRLEEVPNRGRNFAPLFVTFADELSGYDVICHCHSKESRYSGRKQAEWSKYLIDALIGTCKTVERHIELIASGRCEVIAPAPFIGMPPWASHTLSNDHQFRQLTRALGLDDATGFLAYPVGGMFWISGRSFRRIAALGLALDDFPDEPSRPDGELHHAIERVLGRLGGDDLAFFDQVSGHYWAADAVLRAEIARFPPVADLCEVVQSHDIVSFDFFDTLCVRTSGDEEWAKRRVESIFGQDYRARRNAAESRLRERLADREDVPLPQIARLLGEDGFVDVAEAIALERSLDLAGLRPRWSVVKAYEYAIFKKKIVYIASDSYYDCGFIRQFLSAYDISLPNQIFISADLGLRKDRSDMWRHLRLLRGQRKALHVGDNVHSDIQRAAEFGFHSFYVPHWRIELLPFSGFSKTLIERNLTNPGFARTIDGERPEPFKHDLPKPDLDADTCCVC